MVTFKPDSESFQKILYFILRIIYWQYGKIVFFAKKYFQYRFRKFSENTVFLYLEALLIRKFFFFGKNNYGIILESFLHHDTRLWCGICCTCNVAHVSNRTQIFIKSRIFYRKCFNTKYLIYGKPIGDHSFAPPPVHKILSRPKTLTYPSVTQP